MIAMLDWNLFGCWVLFVVVGVVDVEAAFKESRELGVI